jgi:EPS-associated MarR family transcriptional regulator
LFPNQTTTRSHPICHTSIWAIIGGGCRTANDETVFWTLKLLQANPGMTQRLLAKEIGINVSRINFCLKALIDKGWIKMGNFSNNPNKLGYAYLLTPTGVAEKAVLTRRFLQRKMAEYEELREEIEALQPEADQPTPAAPAKPNP